MSSSRPLRASMTRMTGASRAALAIGALSALAVARFWADLHLPVLVDEPPITEAIEHVLAGRSPYEVVRYLYPPPPAILGAALAARWGLGAAVIAMRTANVVGVAAAAWAALAWGPWRGRTRAAIAAGMILFAPPIASALEAGNLSGVSCGLALVALACVEQGPLACGILLGTSVALKPSAIGVLAVLIAHPRFRRAGALAAVTALAFLALGPRQLADMLARGSARYGGVTTGSLVHALECFGVRVPLALPAVVIAGACAWGYTRRPPMSELALVACLASVLSLPLVWTHTLLLALPACAAAAARAIGTHCDASRRALHTVCVFGGIEIVFGAGIWRSFTELDRGLQGVLTLVPLAALTALTRYGMHSRP